jgi:hypothetical protein
MPILLNVSRKGSFCTADEISCTATLLQKRKRRVTRGSSADIFVLGPYARAWHQTWQRLYIRPLWRGVCCRSDMLRFPSAVHRDRDGHSSTFFLPLSALASKSSTAVALSEDRRMSPGAPNVRFLGVRFHM